MIPTIFSNNQGERHSNYMVMSKRTARIRIQTMEDILSKTRFSDTALIIKARIDGIRHVVFGNVDKKSIQSYKDGKNSIDKLTSMVSDSFYAGVNDAQNCRQGRRKNNNVILNQISVSKKTKEHLDIIRKQKNFRHLNDVRKAAYKYFIESELS